MQYVRAGKLVNCAINIVRIDGTNWTVVEWGSTEHLQGTGFQLEAFGGSKTSG